MTGEMTNRCAMMQVVVSNVCSGGTEVTVYGSHLDSVAKPRITVTVVTTRANNDRSLTSESEVIEQFVYL